MTDLREGDVLAGKYRIDRLLGHGGMGVVYAATHVQLQQRVAVKLMLREVLSNAEAGARFVREARAAARITSEHVARVFDVGTLETGEPYMAMEFLEGSDLASIMSSSGRLPPERAVEYLLQACEAIAEAHSIGIVHRDLKPANLFLVKKRDGSTSVKVLDFGISKLSGPDSHDGAVTRTTALMGSPLYMSPEQMMSSRNVDARSDIWSLGVVLYEMLTRTTPFVADTLPQVCTMVMHHPAEPPVRRVPDLPPLLNDVVMRCLEKDPSARFATVAELAQALVPVAPRASRPSIERIGRLLGNDAQVADPPSSAAPAVPHPGTYASWGQTKPELPARRFAPALLIVAPVLLAGAGALVWFGMRHGLGGAGTVPSASAIEPAIDLSAFAVSPPVPSSDPAPAESAQSPVAASSSAVTPPSPPGGLPATGKSSLRQPAKTSAAPSSATQSSPPSSSKPPPAEPAPPANSSLGVPGMRGRR